MTTSPIFEVSGLSAWYGDNQVLRNIDLALEDRQITCIIGPSGCGKSTFIRCLNRMHELIPGARRAGNVKLDGKDIYAAEVDPVLVRRRVGLVFQKPNPFPTMSIRENVLAGLRLTDTLGKSHTQEIVESSLVSAALWDEVKDRLDEPGTRLSTGQQQRLCIARALAVEPEVLLMDEPCSSLDPIATARIEDLLYTLKKQLAIIIVTHNMQQATRVSQQTIFLLGGRVIEQASTDDMFTAPQDPLTEEYITGRFG